MSQSLFCVRLKTYSPVEDCWQCRRPRTQECVRVRGRELPYQIAGLWVVSVYMCHFRARNCSGQKLQVWDSMQMSLVTQVHKNKDEMIFFPNSWAKPQLHQRRIGIETAWINNTLWLHDTWSNCYKPWMQFHRESEGTVCLMVFLLHQQRCSRPDPDFCGGAPSDQGNFKTWDILPDFDAGVWVLRPFLGLGRKLQCWFTTGEITFSSHHVSNG